MSETRRFLGWDRAALPAAAAQLAAHYVAGDTCALGAAVIVLPGARAGRRLKELLIEESAARGLRLVPPRILTVGRIAEELYQAPLPFVDAAVGRRVWARELQWLPREQLMLLFGETPRERGLRDWLRLGAELQSLQQQVAGGGLRFRDVVGRCAADGLLYDDAARWRVLASLQERYEVLLSSLNRCDANLARIEALRSGAVAAPGEVWLVGVAEMPAIVAALLRAAVVSVGEAAGSPMVRALIHAPLDRASGFDDLGCVLAGAWKSAAVPVAEEQLAVVGHPSQQAEEVEGAIRGLAGRYAVDDIVIGVPDAEVTPYIDQRLAGAGVHTRAAGGSAVERSRPYMLLKAIAALMSSGSAEDLAALARHPDIASLLQRVRWQVDHPGAAALREADGWLADLDGFLTARLPSRVLEGLPGTGGPGRPASSALLHALFRPELLGALRGRRRLAEWMPLLLELLLHVYGADALRRDVQEERRLFEACRKLRDAAAALHRMPAELDHECDAATAIRILLDDVAGQSIPPEADAAAIELLGWLELHLDDAPVALITGMNEPFVPEAVNADAFLPDTLRTRLGLLDNDRRAARDAYQLTAMLHSRDDIRLIAGRRTAQGDPLRPSRLLLATAGPALAARISRFFDTAPAGAPHAPDATDGREQSGFHTPPQRVIALPEVPDTLNVTDFAALLGDPWGFALGRVMGGEGLDDSARELDPRNFGRIAHAVVQMFGGSQLAAASDGDAIAGGLSRTLDDYIAGNYGRALLPAVRLQVEQLRLRLRAFARWQAEWAADGWRIVAMECGVDDGVPLDVDGRPIRIRGRIDRIDYNAARDEWAVFDYKTGDAGAHPNETHLGKDGWLDLQLPLYRFILPHVHRDGVRVFTGQPDAVVHLGYILLCGDPEEVGGVMVQWDAAIMESALEAAEKAVRTLRTNHFVYDGPPRWNDDDTAALLGVGRLTAADDDVAEDGATDDYADVELTV
jgi:ATP-dependent helicase/nuclease subunit B